jgi:hypothetical protein
MLAARSMTKPSNFKDEFKHVVIVNQIGQMVPKNHAFT